MKNSKNRNTRLRMACILSLVLLFGTFITAAIIYKVKDVKEPDTVSLSADIKNRVQTKYLQPNKYSRPQIPLKEIKGVVVHYTANPGTDAMANRNYFNNLKKANEANGTNTFASSHFVIGLKGDIIQCIPLEEIAYASNERNSDTISIECCYEKKSGKFNQETYDSLVWLVSMIVKNYDLSREDIIRHYDVTGKLCPKYFVEHEDAWEQFLDDVMKATA